MPTSESTSLPAPLPTTSPTTSPTTNSRDALSNVGLGLHLQQDEEEYEELYPIENFTLVCNGVYRSSFPKKKNFAFMKKLGLKSVLFTQFADYKLHVANIPIRTLILEDYPEQNKKFLDENDIQLFQFGVPGNKEPFVDIPADVIQKALSVICDKRNHPLLIHCNKGKHRTGCLVGCLRKMQHWTNTSIFEEYRRFSYPKSRSMDQQFIELFDTSEVVVDVQHLPDWPELDVSEMKTL